MLCAANVVSKPAIDLPRFLGDVHAATGCNLAAKLDASSAVLGDAERWIECLSQLAAFPVPHAALLAHANYSLLVACQTHTWHEFASRAAGMAMVSGESRESGIRVAIVTGNVGQWLTTVSVCRGGNWGLTELANAISAAFERIGLASALREPLLLSDRR